MYIAMNHFRVALDRAHRQGRSAAGTILGPPRFVGWQVVP
jgi:hypothetical protein